MWYKDLHTLCPFPAVYPHVSTPGLLVTDFPSFFLSGFCPAGYVIHHCLRVCTYSNLRTLLFWHKVLDKIYRPKLYTLADVPLSLSFKATPDWGCNTAPICLRLAYTHQANPSICQTEAFPPPLVYSVHPSCHMQPYVWFGLGGTGTTLEGDMESRLTSQAACSLQVPDIQFHLTIDCYWAPLTLWLGGANRAQLMVGISGHVVTCIVVKCSITGPIWMPKVDFQELCYSLLPMAWPCSRTPGACCVVLPLGFAIKCTFQLFPPLTPPTTKGLLNIWPKCQRCVHFSPEQLQSSFLLSDQVKAGWIPYHLECGLEQFS